MKRIEVAVGVVYNSNGHILVGQRVVKDQFYQKWEFPGGKIELGESPEAALKREFLEETALELLECQPLMTVKHDYPSRHVYLHVFTCHSFDGELTELEGQALRWVSLEALDELDFLKGNQVILDRLKSLST